MAEECGHPYSLAVCLIFASLLALDMRDAPAVRRFVNRANEIAPVGAFQVEDVLVALDAYLKVLSGGVADGIATIRTILARAPADQAAPGLHSALLRILLAACEAAGADGVGAAADELVSLTNSLVWRPESERFRARVRLGRESANA